jgi:hypothetical protein
LRWRVKNLSAGRLSPRPHPPSGPRSGVGMPLAVPAPVETAGSACSFDLESPMITDDVDRGLIIPILLAAVLVGLCAVSLGA